jgi:maltose O-acetyltransferase
LFLQRHYGNPFKIASTGTLAAVKLSAAVSDAVAVVRARWHLRGAHFGSWRVRLRGRPVIRRGGEVIIHDRVLMLSNVARLEIGAEPGGRLEIGERTFINYGVSVFATKSITIGPRCQIGPYSVILDNAWHQLSPEHRMDRPDSQPVVIGENVWLASRVVVLPGVTIGDGSVIAAGAVVTTDIPPRSFAAGVPARVIRTL